MTHRLNKNQRKGIWISLLILSLCLLGLNIYGLFRTLENPLLPLDSSTAFVQDKTHSYEDFLSQYPKAADETNEAYVPRLMTLVSQTIAHYWHTDEVRYTYFGQIPAWENYWLALLGMVGGERFYMYEFFDWRKALQRGVGLCSQHALVTTALLNDQGIAARTVQLNGHVVAEAEVQPDTWWTVDSDFGVLMPFDIDEAAAHTERVFDAYKNIGSLCREEFDSCSNPKNLAETYGTAEDNVRSPVGYAGFSPLGYALEKAAYVLKWLFPLLGLILAGFMLRRATLRSDRHWR